MLGIYKLADIVISIESIYEEVHTMCAAYEVKDEVPRYHIKISQEDILSETEKSSREIQSQGLSLPYYPPEYLETLAVYRKIADCFIQDDILLFHGSVIAVDDVCYLFTAKSGTGKSTHTRLWREHFGERAVMINDDKPLLKITDDGILAYGTPWDGKHHLSTNASCPLRAICILERGVENVIQPITFQEAVPMLLQQCYRPTDATAMMKTLSLINRAENKVGFYRLQCNMDPEVALVSYQGMQE